MREIRFRAWDVTDKRMVWLDYIWNEWWYGSPQGGNGKAVYFNDNKSMDERRHAGFHIMQFTGLHDEKGKELYEGDIVCGEAVWTGTQWNSVTGEIIYDGTCGRYMVRKADGSSITLGSFTDRIEVIGNIYESPELLEAK